MATIEGLVSVGVELVQYGVNSAARRALLKFDLLHHTVVRSAIQVEFEPW